jgi:Tol biopolymer transport system component
MRPAARRSAGLITVLALTGAACTGGGTSNVSGPSITRSSGTATRAATSARIVFTSERDGHGQIYVMNADGTGQANLSSRGESGRGDVRDGDVACSRDGRRLAFLRSTSSGDFVTVWIMEADGSNQTELLPTQVKTYPYEFKPWGSLLNEIEWWSDGAAIGFGDPHHGLRVFRLGESSDHLLEVRGLLGGWSPDRTKAVLGGEHIIVMSADGTLDQLTEGPARDAAPDWSPDGSKIVFESSGRDGKYDADIFVMNADGSGLKRLTTDGGQDAAPAWSPDGSLIAFESDRDGDREVFVMNADGTGQTPLTSDEVGDGHPCWLP